MPQSVRATLAWADYRGEDEHVVDGSRPIKPTVTATSAPDRIEASLRRCGWSGSGSEFISDQ